MKKYRISVPVATIWTDPSLVRPVDKAAIDAKSGMTVWLNNMTRQQTIELCKAKRVQTQALFGDEVIIDEIKDEWAKVYVPNQSSSKDRRGYPGWIPAGQLIKSDLPAAEPVIVQSRTAAFYDLNRRKVFELSFGTVLPLIDEIPFDEVKVDSPLGPGILLKKDVILPDEQHLHTGTEIVRNAERFLELPYLWSGTSAYGYDCSGFTYSMLRVGGYFIPRDADEQSLLGLSIDPAEAAPGDLLFFAYEKGKGYVHHVGIYYDEGRFIHSPTPGAIVSITEIKGSKYEEELCAVRRYWRA
ncbi:C40 family peptidase [Sporolactobacillus sp. CPB3-1]|uniref:C40 family peptidase n=1 Tax=Sporolactobacillus mangiferae TaxID=2940498 RepID=A0ABT0MA81_9BACL|nr:C40 family peptidase [Sporolactobacillus mangiferae]MCL1631762.1 C40 family peptidase [Sporolactobacillus mangiferae]